LFGTRKRKWDEIGARMAPPMTPVGIRKRLNAIIVRRNQIVHEGDYERLERPQSAKRNDISHSDASEHVEFIARLVDAIHAVI
jgi:membrane-associated HD superfamily phosphohydrolase